MFEGDVTEDVVFGSDEGHTKQGSIVDDSRYDVDIRVGITHRSTTAEQ